MPRQEVACVGTTLGRYELTRVLGEGGMATVFEAHDKKLGRQVAVKVMFPHLARREEAVARFKREARAAAGLDHEHILRVFDVGGGAVEEGRLIPPYIVLELVDGESLAEYFQDRGPPLAEVVAAIGVGLCHALTQAHEQNIVHRDIKPANVMVTKKGRLALADFGVAHMSDEDSLVTRTGTILGTPAYMSPEQALSEPVDERSDVYSLGATLYTIATGALPYSGSPAHILASILGGKCKTVEELNPPMGRELSRVIQKMMHIEPAERMASAAAAAEALDAIVHGGGFEDSEEVLTAYFCGPQSDAATMRKTVISATLVRAMKVAEEGRMPLALSLADRVLCLDGDNLQAQTLSQKFGQQRNKRVWPAIFLPMIVTASVGLLFWGSRPGSVAEYVDDVDDAKPLLAESPTSDAGIETPTLASEGGIDAALEIADAAPSPDARTRHGTGPRVRPPTQNVLPIDAGTRVVPVDAAARVAIVPMEPARFIADIKPWCNVIVDGVELGRAGPSKEFSVPAGKHRILCKQGSTGLTWSKDVTLIAGKTKRLTGQVLEDLVVKVKLSGATSVLIDSKRVQNGASVQVKTGRHAVELVKDGKGDGKPEFLSLRQSCTLRDQPKLACFSD